MQGGLVTQDDAVSTTTSGGAVGQPPVTGAPNLPHIEPDAQPGQAPQQGVTVTSTVGEMGPIDRILMGTTWTRSDVELVLQTISTLLLLYWAVTEVQR